MNETIVVLVSFCILLVLPVIKIVRRLLRFRKDFKDYQKTAFVEDCIGCICVSPCYCCGGCLDKCYSKSKTESSAKSEAVTREQETNLKTKITTDERNLIKNKTPDTGIVSLTYLSKITTIPQERIREILSEEPNYRIEGPLYLM